MIRDTIRACLICVGIAIWLAASSSHKDSIASMPEITTQSPSPDVEFDPLRERKKAIFNAALIQTQVCVHDALRGFLFRGVRNRERLITSAKSLCHVAMDYVMKQAGTSDQTDEVMSILAEHELESLLAH